MPEIALDGVSLHYERDGAGPPLLLIAGMASDSASWGPLVAPLAEHFTVIRPDNRLTGRTRPLAVEAGVPVYAADCAALLADLDLGPAHVAGHSMGGLVAMHLSAQRPDLVQSLALLASAPMRSARNQQVLELLLALRAEGQPPDLWLRAFYPWLFRPAFFEDPANVEAALAAALAYPHAQGAEAMARQVAASRGFRAEALAPPPGLPVKALLGAEDLLYPLASAQAALSAIPGIEIEVIPEAAHSLHWDAPQAVAAALVEFFSRAEETGP